MFYFRFFFALFFKLMGEMNANMLSCLHLREVEEKVFSALKKIVQERFKLPYFKKIKSRKNNICKKLNSILTHGKNGFDDVTAAGVTFAEGR